MPGGFRWQFLLLVSGVAAAFAVAVLLARPLRNAALPLETKKIVQTTQQLSELPPTHQVHISRPEGPPRIATGKLDPLGREVTLSCASCHANRKSDSGMKSGEELKEFHQGLHFEHGSLKCVSCHHPTNYNSLRLADGRSLTYENVQTLCSQCHASQARDYQHGAHGGMNGHWDLTRGPRQRKGCIDCHDPHAPSFPRMVPTFKSRDRFLPPESPPGESHE